MTITPQPDRMIPLPAKLRLLLLLTVGVTIGYFVWLTTQARLTNTDDVDHHADIQAGQYDDYATTLAVKQGRFHFAAAVQIWAMQLHGLRSDLGYAVTRAVLFFGQLGLVGWLVARITRRARTGWLVGLGLAAALHFPATYFAALGYPPLWFGFAALLGSLHCQLSFLRGGHRGFAAGSGLLLLLACMMQEIYCAFLPLCFLLALRAGHRSALGLLRATLPQLTAVGSFVVAYVWFSRLYPSTYGGTQLSFDLRALANVVVRHTVAVLPGYELLAHRAEHFGDGPLFKPAHELRTALAGTPWLAYGLAVLQAHTVFRLLSLEVPSKPPGRIAIACLVGIALVPNIVIGLTKTHQMLAYHRAYPYVYSFYTFCALGAAAGLWWEQLNPAQPASAPPRRRLALIVSGGCLLAFLSAIASNHYTVELLRQWFN